MAIMHTLQVDISKMYIQKTWKYRLDFEVLHTFIFSRFVTFTSWAGCRYIKRILHCLICYLKQRVFYSRSLSSAKSTSTNVVRHLMYQSYRIAIAVISPPPPPSLPLGIIPLSSILRFLGTYHDMIKWHEVFSLTEIGTKTDRYTVRAASFLDY